MGYGFSEGAKVSCSHTKDITIDLIEWPLF